VKFGLVSDQLEFGDMGEVVTRHV